MSEQRNPTIRFSLKISFFPARISHCICLRNFTIKTKVYNAKQTKEKRRLGNRTVT
jgi:hypothetical protein